MPNRAVLAFELIISAMDNTMSGTRPCCKDPGYIIVDPFMLNVDHFHFIMNWWFGQSETHGMSGWNQFIEEFVVYVSYQKIVPIEHQSVQRKR